MFSGLTVWYLNNNVVGDPQFSFNPDRLRWITGWAQHLITILGNEPFWITGTNDLLFNILLPSTSRVCRTSPSDVWFSLMDTNALLVHQISRVRISQRWLEYGELKCYRTLFMFVLLWIWCLSIRCQHPSKALCAPTYVISITECFLWLITCDKTL